MLEGIYETNGKRDSENGPVYDEEPPTLPQQLVNISGRNFGLLVQKHTARLQLTFSDQDIARIEDEHATLRHDVASKPLLQISIAGLPPRASFKDSWGVVGLDAKVRYPRLLKFVGGLASPFATTATVESDFSILRWEKDAGRGNLEDFSLEGIVQCKAFDALRYTR